MLNLLVQILKEKPRKKINYFIQKLYIEIIGLNVLC